MLRNLSLGLALAVVVLAAGHAEARRCRGGRCCGGSCAAPASTAPQAATTGTEVAPSTAKQSVAKTGTDAAADKIPTKADPNGAVTSNPSGSRQVRYTTRRLRLFRRRG